MLDPVDATEAWLRDFVVALDLCPFAAGPLRAGAVRVIASRSCTMQDLLADLLNEIEVLRGEGASTTLLVVPSLLADWDDFLDLLAFAEDLLDETGDADFVQLVGFHPDYVFGDAPVGDPANATNRSPFPMLHLLRRDEVARAIEGHPDVSGIPERNMALLRGRAE